MKQALSFLEGWRPSIEGGRPSIEGGSPPGLVGRYEALIRFLEGLPSNASVDRILHLSQTRHKDPKKFEAVWCTTCALSVGTDSFCHRCKCFLWGRGTSVRLGDVPPVEGLRNPASAYPVPLEHTRSPTQLAIWLATCDEMDRIDRLTHDEV